MTESERKSFQDRFQTAPFHNVPRCSSEDISCCQPYDQSGHNVTEEVLAYENAAHTYRYGPQDYEGSVDSVPASPVASECYR